MNRQWSQKRDVDDIESNVVLLKTLPAENRPAECD
jgi:hypothetical protein